MFKHKLLAFWGGVLGSVVVLFLVVGVVANADSANSAWLTPAPLTLQKQAELSSVPSSLNGNVDCFQDGPFNCVVSTLYGAVNQNNQVRLNGTSAYRDILNYVENRPRIIAIPNSSTIISYTTEPPYGFYLYFNYSFASSITSVIPYGGTVSQYKINRPPDGKLADKTNHRLAADYESISFSPNGQWMAVSVPNVAVVRVNLQTFDVVPFAPSFNYTIGLSPAPKTAITNDGRYAVVASKDFSRFAIYDLDTCGAVPSTINGPAACQSRNLQSFIAQQVPGYTGAGTIRFLSNDTLSFYAGYTDNSIRKTAKFILSTAGGVIHQLDYLAVGESYISGEGAFSYQPGTDTTDNHCHLSLVSYPYLIGQDLSYNTYHSVACSGAHVEDVIDTSLTYDGQATPKVKRGDRTNQQIATILTAFQPGYIDQLDFVTTYQPKTITISIGGNDIGFSDIITSCAGFWNLDNCFESYEDRLELVRQINSKFPELVNTYTKLKNQSAPDTKIYVIGYPQIVKTGGDCAVNVHLSDNESEFARLLIDYLDTVIKAAADKVGVRYVDTQDAFYGHRLCEASPGSVAMNGLTMGTDFPNLLNLLQGPFGNESYHPNDFGQQLLENKILDATNNLTDPMPIANSSAAPPPESELEILNAPHEGRAINKTFYDDELANDVIVKNAPAEVSVSGLKYSLKPGASYRVELHSDPLILGNYLTAGNGSLSAQIQIPTSVPAGFHVLHIYGTNLTGEAIDIYKTVYVAATLDDLNGNGITNDSDPCVFIDVSEQDFDQDRIDDACDGNITEASALPTTPEANSSSQNDPIVQPPTILNSTNQDLQPSVGMPSPTQTNPVLAIDISGPTEAQITTTQLPSTASSQPQILLANNNPYQLVEEKISIETVSATPAKQPAKKPSVLAATTFKIPDRSNKKPFILASSVFGLLIAISFRKKYFKLHKH